MLAQLAVVNRERAGIRLDTFLVYHFLGSRRCHAQTQGLTYGRGMTGLSRSAIQKLIARGQVTVNGRRTKAGVRLKLRDCVEVQWSLANDTVLEPEPLPLQILHEDEDLLVVNKPPGMVVHPAAGNLRGTLVNAVLYYFPNLQTIGGERRPGIVHRLDKDTSGVMVVAKDGKAFQHLALQFKERRIWKEYVALVWGRVDGQRGIIDRPIGRHRRDRKRMSSIHTLSRSREAVTEWEVEGSFCMTPGQGPLSWVTLLRLRPHTGRTHQIRVHLADRGHPVVGDRVYGRKKTGISKKQDLGVLALTDFPRQALHAERLRLTHPRTGAPLDVIAPWFQDMRDLLDSLKEGTLVSLWKTGRGG
ncbi:MAG: RluA family pseudouridine synthase [Candidatus Binatia bacterium]